MNFDPISPFSPSRASRPIRRLALAGLTAAALTAVGASTAQTTPETRPHTTPANQAPACPALLNRQALRLQDEKPQNLCQYAGKVVLVVNTASFCGFTPQYKGLETLQARYSARGLVVLGFPSNDFNQEPGTGKEIADFCENTFGVKFPMFTKTSVITTTAQKADPLFAELKQRTGTAPGWNFHKYLIARDGNTVQSFGTRIDPLDAAFVKQVEALLAATP